MWYLRIQFYFYIVVSNYLKNVWYKKTWGIQTFFYNLSLKKILRYLFYWQVTALVTTDNKDQDSRLPDYALKISRVFIHICLFIPLIIILRLKLDTFNSEERGTAEEEPMYQWSLTSNLRREIGKKTVYQYGGSWKIWMYFSMVEY